MAGHMIETPRTEVGDQTRLTAHALDFSMEQSFQSPSKDSNDLLRQLRGARGGPATKTPQTRNVLGDRRNPPGKPEFTPLLKSASRNRLLGRDQKGKDDGVPQTPAFLKPGYTSNTPSLPVDSSAVMYGEHTGSSADLDDQGTPAPPAPSSSAMSTPIPMPNRKGEGLLNDGNMMSLKEQEARLVQIDKENFGLKLKIHFLEENLKKRGNEFQQETIRQNTELRVDKVTLIRDIKQYRKSLSQAEKDLEEYRQQLQDYAEKVKRRHADQGMLEELDRLRKTAEDAQRLANERDAELKAMQERLRAAEQQDDNAEKLRDDIGDLEAELREKDRALEEKDEELEALQEKLQSAEKGDIDAKNLREDVDELEAELREKDQL
ncbi:putative spindle-pole body protein, partial [Cryomyces antarcticus]